MNSNTPDGGSQQRGNATPGQQAQGAQGTATMPEGAPSTFPAGGSGLSKDLADELNGELRSATRARDWMTYNVVLLNKGAGWTQQQIADFYGLSVPTVGTCLNAFAQGGIKGLRGFAGNWF